MKLVLWDYINKYELTKCGGIESGPSINDAPVSGDNRLVDAVTDHHHISLALGNVHVFLVQSRRYVDQEVTVTTVSFVWRGCNGVVYGREVSRPVLIHRHNVAHLNSVYIRLEKLSPSHGVVNGTCFFRHL